MTGIIYKTQNLITGKCYVGIHTRMDAHYLGSGRYLNSAIKIHGRNNFRRTVIDEFDDLEVGLAKERYWIRELHTKSPSGYNLTDGGGGVFNPCQEVREKISLARKGKPSPTKGTHLSEEHKNNIRLALIGKPSPLRGRALNEETKRKLSFSKTGKKRAPNRRPSPRKGQHLSEETRKKMSLAQMGRPAWNKGMHHGHED